MRERTLKAKIAREQQRTIGIILNREKRPQSLWWLSFAGEEGFLGVVLVHAEDMMTALMESTLRGLNPQGECRGMCIPPEYAEKIAEHWKYKLLSRNECQELERENAVDTNG